MLTVDVDQRITIDECLEHSWTTGSEINPNDSTDGLTGGIQNLDFKHRKPVRERTLLASINDVKISRVVAEPNEHEQPIKIFEKNPGKPIPSNKNQAVHVGNGANGQDKENFRGKEANPSDKRKPEEFIGLGGKGDVPLFGDDTSSIYEPEKVIKAPS